MISFLTSQFSKSLNREIKVDDSINSQLKPFFDYIEVCNQSLKSNNNPLHKHVHYDFTYHNAIEPFPFTGDSRNPLFHLFPPHLLLSKYSNLLFPKTIRHLIIDEYPLSKDEDGKLSAKYRNLLRHFISGGIAGAISRTSVAPLDVIKVHLQVTKEIREDQLPVVKKSSIPTITRIKHFTADPNYRSKFFTYYLSRQIIYNVILLRKICVNLFREDGLFAFWKGNGINILKVVPEKACRFMFYELVSS